MKFELFTRVVLTRDIPQEGLCQGGVGTRRRSKKTNQCRPTGDEDCLN